MKALKNIVKNAGVIRIVGNENIRIKDIAFDSRKVKAKSLFVAFKGTQTDGHAYIDKSVENGASAVVCDKLPVQLKNDVVYVLVENSQRSLAIIASNFYDNPSEKIILVGITGTNGKTTIATLLYDLFRVMGHRAGLVSTVENFVDLEPYKATHTTPDPIQINHLLYQMTEADCEYCFMEVSSHAIDQQRIAGLDFNGGVFTNITHDHLDYHKDFKSYIKAKKTFFDKLQPGAFALVNKDDKNAQVMLQNTKARPFSFGMKSMADYRCKILEHHFDGMSLLFDKVEVWTRFIGEFNASNLLAVYAAACLLDAEKEEVLTKISQLTPVRGRLETMRSVNKITAIVDYAHTPDALQNVLQTLDQIKTGKQQLITVIGAGGNRDKNKRPVMAKNALKYSDKVILTSDNPRFEKPLDIIHDMEAGIENNKDKVLVIEDRKQAIKTACMLAKDGDIVLVAGKGHETYQDIKGVKYPFDDKEVIKECLNIS